MVWVFRFGKKKRIKEKESNSSFNDLIAGFDEEAYLEANPDVKEGIEKGQFKDVKHHLKTFGFDEIKKGLRKFHNDFESYDEALYLESFPDINELIEKGTFKTAFQYFYAKGYTEIIEGTRPWERTSQEDLSGVSEEKVEVHNSIHEQLKETKIRIIDGFDEEAYLKANPDVAEGIEKGQFKDAKHHLEIFGFDEIKKGLRNFHKDFELFDRIEYLKLIPELQTMIQEKKYLDEFDHFIKIGYKQIINRKIDLNLAGAPYVIPDVKKVSKLVGAITEYKNGKIRGWCYSDEKFEPLLLINGRPCKIIKSNISIPKVAQNNKLDRDDIGFVAEISEGFMDATNISLYAIFPNSCVKITSTNKFTVNNVSPRSLSVFNDLKQISSKKNAVAIVVWDVTHNPIGRAKVLYDIVKEKHPVIMIGFDFGFSKSEVWEPIASSEIKLLSIKWDERELYSQIMQDMNISFDTVWICKPRLPSFVLADMFSNKKTKFILDIDDNESEMSQANTDIPKPYGALGNHLAESMVKKIDAKSVASISIKDHWGGEFVRHTRQDIKPENIKQRRKLPEKIKIGFFGTVRPHKHIDKAAEMIQKIQRDQGIDLEFNVGGHFYPDELRKTIEGFGAKTYGVIPNEELFELLDDMDVLITGFPLDTNENEISKYQISSKIGDALSAGRPVLVPEGSSVKDLVDVPGIYLFNEDNFSEKLLAAINHSETITLPSLFTLSDNYKMFKKLKKIASKKKKSDIFTVPLLPYTPEKNSEAYRPTLVLLWKQPDSTLYGRRVEQLARSYKRKYPSHRVVLIETMNADQEKYYKSQKDYYVGDSALILERLREKRITLEREGVEHIFLEDQMFNEEDAIRSFLLSQKMLPQNTLFVLFPLIGYFEKFFNIIDGYRYIADIVDNQLGWKSKYPEKIIKQYKIICKNAENVVFNSGNNRQFFIDHGLIEEAEKSLQIANWYELPETSMGEKLSAIEKNSQKIFYSGNMNDRIDWELIENLLYALPEGIILYLVGNACSSGDKLKEILSRHDNCQFLGPIDERILIQFIEDALFAIIPHTVEATSQYMNPLKIYMYASLGIECISTAVPGLERKLDHLIVCNGQVSFIAECLNSIYRETCNNIPRKRKNLEVVYIESRDRYLRLLSEILKENQ